MSKELTPIEAIIKLDLNNLQPPNILTDSDKDNFNSVKLKLEDILKLLKKLAPIASLQQVPSSIRLSFKGIADEFLQCYNEISQHSINGETSTVTEQLKQKLKRVESYCFTFYNVNTVPNALFTISSLLFYSKDFDEDIKSNLSTLKSDLITQVAAAKALKDELSEKASIVTISNYAETFAQQETSNNTNAFNWALCGCTILIFFITGLVCSIHCNWFPNTIILTSKSGNIISTQEIFNYPILITKAFIISMFVYIITFCFKQYNINKHLEVIHQHKKNSLNSYKLFEASLQNVDDTIKNTLLQEVAKAIYSLPNSGFIANAKESSKESNFFDITKVVKES